MSRRSTQHVFSQVPSTDIPRSSFNRSHTFKTTFDAGTLVPFYIDEVLPGDTFNMRANLFARMSTPIVPAMDNAYLDTFFFFVPYRLIWRHWREFNGENLLAGIQSTEYLVPQVKAPAEGGFQVGNLADYFGFPTGVANLEVCAFPFRAYWKVFSDWFRDENLMPVVNTTTGQDADGTMTLEQYLGDDAEQKIDPSLLYRCKRHDYFTSALPWPQKGPGVELPLGVSGDISGSVSLGNIPTQSVGNSKIGGFKANLVNVPGNFTATAEDLPSYFEVQPGALQTWNDLSIDGKGVVDLSSATAVTINSLRQAFQLQKLYERDARGGTRYTEILRSHFGVVSPDARLQRSEYLGGMSTPIMINPVTQTSASDSTTPQGNLAAFALASSKIHGFTKSFTEHGLVIGLVNVRTDLSYQQGLNRAWSRRTRFDFYWPALAHLGEQAVLNKEIYAQASETDDDVFGYQERWAEYRYHPSMITGKFRSTYAQSLDVWHFAQKFDALPNLNRSFMEDHASYDGIKRMQAVQDEPQFLLDAYIQLRTARPMPVYSVPGLVDHF